MDIRSHTPGALVKWASRIWVVPCLAGLAILVLSVILLISGGFGINSVSWPQRVVEAAFWVTAVLAPTGGVSYTLTSGPWRALGRAARELFVVLLIATAVTVLALLICDHGRIVAQASEPVLYAAGGFIAAWIMLMAVVVAAVVLGVALVARQAPRRSRAVILVVGGLLAAEGVIWNRCAVTLRAFFDRTLGGAGLLHWVGIPFNGVVFPWATFDHIILVTAVVGLACMGGLGVAAFRSHRLLAHE